MKTLLTGGSGFIGSHFHNVIDNRTLINLDLNTPQFSNGAEFIRGDIRILEDVERAVQNKDVSRIISLAAKHHDFGIGHEEYFDTNEAGTQVICDVAAKFGIKEIVFYSSVAVYGSIDEISNEEQNPLPDSSYGKSKLAGENVLYKWASEDISRKVLIIRPALVFGANNVANMFKLIRQIDSGMYFHIGKADNIKSIAYVENLVKATLFQSTVLKPGITIFNYADEPQLTSREIADVISEVLQRKIRFSLPRTLAIMMGLPFDLFIFLTGKNLPISSSRIKKLSTQTLHSAEKIFKTQFKPDFTTKEGLQKMVEWYKQNRHLKPL